MAILKKFWGFFLLAAMLMSGCREVKRHYVINPDLSGKVEVHSKTGLDPLMQLDSQSKQPDSEKIKRAAKSILDSTAGIDVWKEVTLSMNDEGKLEFKGTAYFKDFNALNLDTSITSSNRLVLSNEGNKLTLQWKQSEKRAHDKVDKIPPFTAQALEKQIKIEKAKFKTSFGMLSTMLSGLKEEDVFTLPGKNQSVKGFKTAGETIVLSVIGDDMLAAIKKLAEDDSFWRKNITNGINPLKDEPEDIQLQVFGAPLPFEAIFKDGNKLFDYESEVLAAKAANPAMLKALGIMEKPKPIPTATRLSKFKTLRVGGISHIFESDPERGIQPNSQNKGYTVYLIGEWDGAVEKINEVTITEAITDNNENLLPDDSSSGFFSSPQLSNDKTAVVFPATLKPPGSEAKKLKKLAGTVSFNISSGVKKYDSGLIKPAVGTKSKELNLEITKATKRDDMHSAYSIAFRVAINSNLLTDVKFYDDKNNKIENVGSANSCINDDCEFEYTFEGEMPTKIGIIINAHETLQSNSTPFMIENLPLIGK